MKKRNAYAGASKESPTNSKVKNPFVSTNWEEEYEDEIFVMCSYDGGMETKKGLEKLVEKYLGNEEYIKVKIKAKKGKIVIERIK